MAFLQNVRLLYKMLNLSEQLSIFRVMTSEKLSAEQGKRS